jgi:polar amino acid transport system substrate-binding protein
LQTHTHTDFDHCPTLKVVNVRLYSAVPEHGATGKPDFRAPIRSITSIGRHLMNHQLSQTTRRAFISSAAVLGALALSSCAGSSSAGSAAEGRTITIGMAEEAPYAYTDTATGKLIGIDGEILTRIAEAKGWKIKTFATDFATLIPALEAKKADLVVDCMFITDQRKEKINFTDPLYLQPESMVVPEGSAIASASELKDKVIGAQTGTVYAEWAKTLGGRELKFFDTNAALFAAVENSQVDAAFTDSGVAGWTVVQKPESKLKIVSPYKPHFAAEGIIGAGVRKEDTELLAELNDGLAELKKTPVYVEILKKYGLSEQNAAN